MSFFADQHALEWQDRVDFYHHAQDWKNRMILGDSLLVMTSLAEKEGLKGQVQMIYLDPPYGIKFGSNWQVSTRKRDVKDGKAEDVTRQPEQVKAFRDTWKLGIHSYLAYLRDRLNVARDLLTETGSIFVQIGDENVHRIRCVLDEVFGDTNFCAEITFRKTSGIESDLLATSKDWLLWYAKDKPQVKFRRLFLEKRPGEAGAEQFEWIEDDMGNIRRATPDEMAERVTLPAGYRLLSHNDPTAVGFATTTDYVLSFQGSDYRLAPNRRWRSTPDGMRRMEMAGRLFAIGNTLRQKRYYSDYPVYALTDWWEDTGISGFGDKKIYVVQQYLRQLRRAESGLTAVNPTQSGQPAEDTSQ